MTKVLQKDDYYLLLGTVAHCSFMRVLITCGVNEKQLVSELTLLQSITKPCKMSYVKWRANSEEHTEEALFNLSFNNIYLLFVSFCHFHKNVWPQLGCEYT